MAFVVWRIHLAQNVTEVSVRAVDQENDVLTGPLHVHDAAQHGVVQEADDSLVVGNSAILPLEGQSVPAHLIHCCYNRCYHYHGCLNWPLATL